MTDEEAARRIQQITGSDTCQTRSDTPETNEELKTPAGAGAPPVLRASSAANNDQLGFYMSTATTELVVGGVRAGKTEIAIKNVTTFAPARTTLSQRLKVR